MSTRLPICARLGLVLAIALMTHFSAHSEEGEFYVNTYRGLGKVSPIDSRSAAMGRAGRGLADGVASLGVNPAALGAFCGTAADASLGFDWLDDGYDDTTQTTFKVGGAVNLDRWSRHAGPNQAVGALLMTQNYSGAGQTDMKRDQTSVLMAYGLHLMDDLLAGVSVALYNGKMKSEPLRDDAGVITWQNYDRKFIGGDFKVGGLYRFSDDTTMGGTLGYMTGSLKERAAYSGNAGSGSLERFSIGIGAAHQYTDETLFLGDLWYERTKSDVPGVLNESNKSWGLSVGVEQQVLPDLMALRGGLYYEKNSYSGGNNIATFVNGNSFSKGRWGITAGVGVKLYSFDLGYSLDVNSGGDVKNILDVSTDW
ncbi:MAG: hypothetical protein LUC93_11845 [Planctomycetaceae bacterium]|nr:hypothetical protein [Planctomycetaceae bacterium]